PKHVEVFPISSLNKEGGRALVFFIADTSDKIPKSAETEELVTITHIPEESPFHISRADDGAFILSGPTVERLFEPTHFTSDTGKQKFARRLRHMWVDQALRDKGATDGDIVRLYDTEFEFIE